MRALTKNVSKERKQDESPSVKSLVQYYPITQEMVEAENPSREYPRRYWYALRRHLGFIATLSIIATLVITIYELRQPDEYEAKARIEVDRDNPQSDFKNQVSSSEGLSGDSVYFNTQLQNLSSVGLLRRVTKTLDLEHNDAFLHPKANSKRSTWQQLLLLVGLKGEEKKVLTTKNDVLLTTRVANATPREDLQEAKTLEPYVAALTRGLRVEPIRETRTDIKETRLIDITFNHGDPQIAARVANAIADLSAYMNLERKKQATVDASDFLQKRIAELQSQIRHDEEQLLDYAEKNQIISLDASQNTVVERLAGLNRELLDAENERAQADAAYKAALAPESAEALAGEMTKQHNAETKLGDLRQRRAQLLVENTEEWPEVKEIDKQIVELENQIKEQRTNASSDLRKTLETRYRQALAREQSVRAAFNEQRALTLSQNQAAINYKIMQQGIDTNKNMLQSLLQHAKENDLAQAGVSNSIVVVDYASAPERPIGPKRLRNIGLGFVLSLGFAVGLVLVREIFDNTVRSITDIEKKLHTTALAVVPSVGRTSVRDRGSMAKTSALVQDEQVQPRPELLLGGGTQPIAEIFRQLRATLLLSRDGLELRSLLVTSSLPGEGKTATAINTAVSLAESGANVLLIDGDLRRPGLHKIFDVSNDRGFSTALSDGLAGSDLLSIIKRPEPVGLSLLTAGPPLKNPTKLFEHERLCQVLATLEANFTHVVIDSPPIVPFADSVILGSEVDGVLMVVQGSKSPHEIVLRSMQLLEDVDALILGVILNNTKLQPLETYYQSYCYKYYERPDGEAMDTSPEVS